MKSLGEILPAIFLYIKMKQIYTKDITLNSACLSTSLFNHNT